MPPLLVPSRSTPRTRRVILAGFLLLFVLHQDFWAWGDRRLVWGFLPLGLFYHAMFSVAAGLLWALANHYAWPDALERWANEPVRAEASASSPSRPARCPTSATH